MEQIADRMKRQSLPPLIKGPRLNPMSIPVNIS